jgi:hypothetical protein
LTQRVEVLNGFKACSVAAGESASCAVAASGELFTWGNRQFGRLEHSDTDDQLAPRRADALHGE